MKIEAGKSLPFGSLMRDMTEAEAPGWSGSNVRDLGDLIRRELRVLEEQKEMIEPNEDMVLEALVRIAALARFAAAEGELAYAKGVSG